jgi:hypothetical protein
LASHRRVLWWLAKVLEGFGLVIVLVGVFISMNLGFEDQGLASMASEFRGLALGGALFVAGVLIERSLKTR